MKIFQYFLKKLKVKNYLFIFYNNFYKIIKKMYNVMVVFLLSLIEHVLGIYYCKNLEPYI